MTTPVVPGETWQPAGTLLSYPIQCQATAEVHGVKHHCPRIAAWVNGQGTRFLCDRCKGKVDGSDAGLTLYDVNDGPMTGFDFDETVWFAVWAATPADALQMYPEHFRRGWCDACKAYTAKMSGYEVTPDFCPKCAEHLDTFPDVSQMNLIDLMEMLCDWKAVTLRSPNGDIRRSIEENQKRFGYSDELKAILLNTVAEIEGD